jgi:hypothetical protein
MKQQNLYLFTQWQHLSSAHAESIPDLADGETNMSNKLHNKVALVTGGTTGIGLATAQALADEGAQVFITGRRQAELDVAVRTIGHGAIGIRSDASKLDELDAMYAQIKEKAGRLNVLFANAGGGDMLPLGAITESTTTVSSVVTSKGCCSPCRRLYRCWRTGRRSFSQVPPPAPRAHRPSASKAPRRRRCVTSRAVGRWI